MIKIKVKQKNLVAKITLNDVICFLIIVFLDIFPSSNIIVDKFPLLINHVYFKKRLSVGINNRSKLQKALKRSKIKVDLSFRMENIKVVLRVRPLSEQERLSQEQNVFDIINRENIVVNRHFIKELLNTKRMALTTKISYAFDMCFDQDASNYSVFQQSVQQVSQSVIHGINSTIFMYGQTGSGKTYTTLGPIGDTMENAQALNYQQQTGNISERVLDGDQGVLLLALDNILNSIQNSQEKTYLVRCSYFEIYNENVYDLLKNRNSLEEALLVNENNMKDFVIKGLREVDVASIQDVLQVILEGESNRHYAETILNHSSSRSHTIFKLYVHSYENEDIIKMRQKMTTSSSNINDPNLLRIIESSQNTVITESCLNFVDLAGSEKISNHHSLVEDPKDISVNGFGSEEQNISAMKVVKERIKESQSINKSLFFLTQVISLQSQNKASSHIPYRNSALTKILKSSLGGNSRTLVILCVTPTSTHFEQSLSTMRFGQNAKKIKNNVEVNYRRDLYQNYYDNRSIDAVIASQNFQIDLEKKQRMSEEIDNLKSQLFEVTKDKNEIMSKLKKLMKKTISQQENDMNNQMLPVQLHKEAGIIFHTAQTLKNSTIYASIDKNVCDLLFDYEGSIALNVAKKCKQSVLFYEQKHKILEQNFNQIVQHYLQTYNELIDQKEELNNFKWRYTVIDNKYKELRQNTESALRRLDLYENMSGISEISNQEINQIENQLFSALDKLKLEKAKRIFKDEINSLKIKLGLKEGSNNQKNSKNGAKEEVVYDYDLNRQQSHNQEGSEQVQELQRNNKVSSDNQMQSKNGELKSALARDAEIDEQLMIDRISQEQENNKKSETRSQSLSQQRELIRQIFFKNISQESDDNNQQLMKLNQIEELMLDSYCSDDVDYSKNHQNISQNTINSTNRVTSTLNLESKSSQQDRNYQLSSSSNNLSSTATSRLTRNTLNNNNSNNNNNNINNNGSMKKTNMLINRKKTMPAVNSFSNSKNVIDASPLNPRRVNPNSRNKNIPSNSPISRTPDIRKKGKHLTSLSMSQSAVSSAKKQNHSFHNHQHPQQQQQYNNNNNQYINNSLSEIYSHQNVNSISSDLHPYKNTSSYIHSAKKNAQLNLIGSSSSFNQQNANINPNNTVVSAFNQQNTNNSNNSAYYLSNYGTFNATQNQTQIVVQQLNNINYAKSNEPNKEIKTIQTTMSNNQNNSSIKINNDSVNNNNVLLLSDLSSDLNQQKSQTNMSFNNESTIQYNYPPNTSNNNNVQQNINDKQSWNGEDRMWSSQSEDANSFIDDQTEKRTQKQSSVPLKSQYSQPQQPTQNELKNNGMNNSGSKNSSNKSFILDLAQNLNNINEKILFNKSQESSPARQLSQQKGSNQSSVVMNSIKEEQQEQNINNSNNKNNYSKGNKTQLSNLVNPLKAKMKEFKRNLSGVSAQPEYEDQVQQTLLIRPQKLKGGGSTKK